MKLDALIEKGHKYIESEKGTEFLRNAQKKALHFTKASVFEQASGYIQQLEKSEESKNSRALAFSFVFFIFAKDMQLVILPPNMSFLVSVVRRSFGLG